MRLKLCSFLLFFLFLIPAAAFSLQEIPEVPEHTPGHVPVRGQVYLPDGAPLQRSIQLRIQKDDSTHTPEIVFTNAQGRFTFEHEGTSEGYTITIEAEGSHWGATSVSVRVSRHGDIVLRVQLQPPQVATAPGSVVSASSLQQKIPRAARQRFEAAAKLLVKGEKALAIAEFERAIAIFPAYADAHNEIGVLLLKSGELPHAEEHLRLAVKADAASATSAHNLGLCLQLAKHFADAQPFLEKAVQLRPDQPSSLLVLGFNLVMLGEDTAAEPHLRRAYELGGSSVARSQLLLAQLYTRRQDYSRAAAALETYLRGVPADPDSASLHVTLEKLRAAAPSTQPH